MMIQRIQSVYLLLAFISLSLLFLFPVLEYSAPDKGTGPVLTHKLYAFEETVDNPVTKTNPDYKTFYTENSLVIVLCMLFVLAAIFFYTKRKRQMAFCWLAILCMLIATVLIYFRIKPNEVPASLKRLGIGAFPLSVSMLLTVFARRSIKKDEDLIRSADRLR